MLLVLPCGGESTRFAGLRPKWLLTQPNGSLMVCDSIKSMDLKNIKSIVLIATKKHLEQYKEQSIIQAFKSAGITIPLTIYQLENQTRSQPETVAKYLETLSEDTPFFIKDCDSQFDFTPTERNEIVVGHARLLTSDVVAKSYCQVTEYMDVLGIVEKQVISEYFCVGGYSFKSSKQYLESYKQLASHDNLYVSHVISNLLLNENVPFSAKECQVYEDWGTYDAWQKYRETFCTLFLDLDGVLVENGSEHFEPRWGSTNPIKSNVEAIKNLQKTNRAEIVLVTSRNETAKEATEKQLKELGIEYKQIVYGLNHSKRLIVNDYSKTNPYPSCVALSIPRNTGNLEEVLPKARR